MVSGLADDLVRFHLLERTAKRENWRDHGGGSLSVNRDSFEESLFRSYFLAVEVNGEGVGGVVVSHRGAGSACPAACWMSRRSMLAMFVWRDKGSRRLRGRAC